MANQEFTIPQRIELAYQKAIRRLLVPAMPRRKEDQTYQEWLTEIAAIGEQRKIADAAAFIAGQMVRWVNVINARTWREASARSQRSRMLYDLLQHELQGPVGARVRQMIRENAGLITRIPTEVAERLTADITRMQQEGARPETIAKMLRERFPQMTSARIRLISRTEAVKASASLTQARAEALRLPAYIWQTVRDSRVRPSHQRMQGVVVLYADPPSPEALIGEHSTLGTYHAGNAPNCFTGDTVIGQFNGLQVLWRAPYTGNIVDVTFDGGMFSVTPNHPMLTGNGWRRASELQVGDNLIQTKRDSLLVGEQNVNQGETTFENLFAAFSKRAKSAPGFAFNFYGDLPDGEVDVIPFDDELTGYVDSLGFESRSDLPFAMPDRWIMAEDIGAVVAQVGGALAPSLRHQAASFIESHASHAQGVGSRDSAPGNMTPFEDSRDSATADPEVIGDPLFANSGNVLLDDFRTLRIVKIEVRNFSGHVFTLQTKLGFYGVTPARIIARNCRCPQRVILTLDDIEFPARVYSRGSIRRMYKQDFIRLTGIREERAA